MATSAPPTTALAPGLARKVKKVLEIKAESPELVEALGTLSQLHHENTPGSRRALRSVVERRGLEISDTFINAAEAVIQALNQASSNLEGLSGSCNRIFSTLAAAKAASQQLANDSDRIAAELEAVDLKVRTVNDFLAQYQVSEEEVLALQTEDATDTFFAALAHVQRIYDNCRALLRTHHQRAGMELMEQMVRYRETAYERLCRWIQLECRSIGDMDAPAVSIVLQKAVAALRDRHELFKLCVEEIATARHNALFQRFITALTRGGPGGVPRPIELHAHDPKRYINDMLAWVHQALADEREFVMALFGASGDEPRSQTGRESHAPPHRHGSGLDGQSDGGDGGVGAAAVLDRVFDSICRPLRVRIEQVLMGGLNPLLCFQLAQLHSFYLSLVLRVLGPAAQLVQVLRACRDMAQRVFMEQMRMRADKLVRHPPAPPKDLSAPPQVVEAVHGMLEVVDAHESAMQAAPTPTGASAPEELQPVFALLLDSLLDACQRSAESLQPDAPTRVDEGAGAAGRLPPSARSTYLINCLSTAAAAVSQRRSAGSIASQLAAAAEQHVQSLVDGEVRAILARVGCVDILDRLQLYLQQRGVSSSGAVTSPPPEGQPVQGAPASDPSLSYNRIVDALRSFFMLLSSPDALPEFRQIQVPRTRAAVSSQFAAALADAYDTLYGALEDPRNGYLDFGGAASVRNTPAQVRTVLGLA